MRNLKPVGIEFDHENPFTHCDTNNIITTEEEHALLGMTQFDQKQSFQPNRAAFTHAAQFYKKDKEISFPEQIQKKSYYRVKKRKNNFGLNHIKLKNSHSKEAIKHHRFGQNPSKTSYNQVTHSDYHLRMNKNRNVKSSSGRRVKTRRIPVYERLHGLSKHKSREGYFRKLKGQLTDIEMNKKKDSTLAKNISKYESQKVLRQQLLLQKDKTAELKKIDYENIIAKPKKMSMKNYVNYKREIFLSVMRQKDIGDNIKDMNNLITEAKDELDSNLKKNKESMFEMNRLVKKSRFMLDKVKNEISIKEKELNQLGIKLTQKTNSIHQIMNDVKDMGEHVKVLRMYEAFVIKIKNQNEVPIPSEDENESEDSGSDTDSSDYTSTKFSQAPNPFMTNTNNLQPVKEESETCDIFPSGHILGSFYTPDNFVDLLRAIEAENLFVISLSQTTKEDMNQLNMTIQKTTEEGNIKVEEINENIRKLRNSRDELIRKILKKKEFLNTKLVNIIFLTSTSAILPI